MTKSHLVAVLVLVSLLSYFLSLFLASFISRGVLEFSEETIYFLLAAVIFIGVLIWLVRSGYRVAFVPADPLTPAEGTAWQIFKNEWRENRRDITVVITGTAVLFGILWWGWGVEFAGDGTGFIRTYLQLDDKNPAYYTMQLYWLPFTGLFYGGLLSLGGTGLVVVGQFFQAVTASTAIYLIARSWGRPAAWLMVIFWWADLSYQVYFHMVGADGMMVWLIPFWMLALRYAVQFQRPAFWGATAVMICLNTLMRGGNLLLLVSLSGLLLSGDTAVPGPYKHFIKNLLAAVLPVIVILGGVSLYNGLRYGHYGITRGSNIVWWSTVYYPKSYVAPENGAATRRFAGYVESILLTHPLYENITLDEFFSVPSHRFIDDARAIPDLTEGWHTNYAIFREIAWEAFQKHPTDILLMRTEAFARLLLTKEALRMPAGSTAFADTHSETTLIDRPALEFMRSQPDNTLADPQHTAENDAQLNEFVAPIDRPDGHIRLADWIGWLWVRLGISPFLWAVGVLLALLKTRGRSRWFLLLLLVGMVLVVLPASMVNMQPRYRIPFDPIFILCLVVSLTPHPKSLSHSYTGRGTSILY